MCTMINLKEVTIASLRKRLDEKELTVSDLNANVIHNAVLLNLDNNAFSDILGESALRYASLIDEQISNGEEIGKLAGIPIAVKDNIDTFPAVCSAGLSIFESYKPKRDAEIVKMLRDAGAIVIGVARTDSGAFGVTTPEVINPSFPDLTVGGSSGGPAATVAAGQCKVAIGTDTGGSIRIPAACCGLYGFKPSFGRISMDGIRPLTYSNDHVGPLATSIEDIIDVMDVIDPNFTTIKSDENINAKTIGIAYGCFEDASNEVKEIFGNFIKVSLKRGLIFKDVKIPKPSEVIPIHIKISLSEAADIYSTIEEESLKEFPAVARDGILIGREVTAEQISIAKLERTKIIQKIDEVLDDVDFIIMPTLPILPPRHDEEDVKVGDETMDVLLALIRYTAIFDQTGHPALAFPWVNSKQSIPGSIQIIGKTNSDYSLLDFAKKYTLLEN